MSQKTWGGRFSNPTDTRVERYSESISFDHRLYRHDILASKAHARMLADVGILTRAESERIQLELDAIAAMIEAGQMEFRNHLEDIHTHVESELIHRLGDLGRKLHTARSRNDQVVTDVKLWIRDAIAHIDRALFDLQRAFCELAEREIDVILPGYTHMQRAQPILASHQFLCFIEKFERDRGRLADCRKRLNALPLGAAALAGTSLPIDRHRVAAYLGFDSVAANSLDISSDRDFVAEFVFTLSLIALHLSNWSEEWIMWTTTEFSAIELPDEFCTGSSIMPHKKNPDVLELTRGKCARVLGNLNSILILLKGLPLAYNRDLQEDKPALFDAFDTIAGALEVAAPLVRGAKLKREALEIELENGFLDATTLMEFLIARGLPMRSAHEAVGTLVKECEKQRCRLSDLPDARYDQVMPGISRDVRGVLGVKNALNAFRSYGSTAPSEVRKQLDSWQARLKDMPQG